LSEAQSSALGGPGGAAPPDQTTQRFGEPVIPGFDHVFRGDLVHSERSAFQKVDVYDHEHFGRVLLLDDLVQTTERDEFCYHEMLVHPALSVLDNVERVLVIGGGDGGTLRHVLMHDPAEAVMCEIDEAVVRVSREHMPALSDGAFDDPRARLVIGDGAALVADHTDAFDAILVDSTDPIGAAVVLFSEEFYLACRKALRPHGVLVSQTGSPVYQGREFKDALANIRLVFPTVEVYLGFVPTYPGVLWSFTSATSGTPVSAATTDAIGSRLQERSIATRFYTPDVHRSAFALPAFVQELCAPAEAASLPRG
jgi:spermidine synthase